MKSKYLLSSIGIHLVVALLLSPMVLLTPPTQSFVTDKEVFVELQKDLAAVNVPSQKKILPRIVVEACRNALKTQNKKQPQSKIC